VALWRILIEMKPPRVVTRRHLPSSPFQAPVAAPIEHYAVHDRVTHDQYGLGTVIGVEEDIAVLVDFGPRRERIVSPYNKLSKL
jgi:hypothetical protein